MKKIPAIFLFIALFCGSAMAQLSFDVTLKQDIKLDDISGSQEGTTKDEVYSTWDFGSVKKGRTVEHEFIFTNNTAKVIKIVNLDTSCGCAVSEAAKKVISAGESAAIKVKFDSSDYLGPVKQYVYMHTDDQESPLYKFVIKANVYK